MQDYHAEFVEIYNKSITRPGADRLLNWLETTDFFTAPASTRFHGACECGLVMHSINVYNAMMQHFFTEGEAPRATPSAACCTTCARRTFTRSAPATSRTTLPASGKRSRFIRWLTSCPTATARKACI